MKGVTTRPPATASVLFLTLLGTTFAAQISIIPPGLRTSEVDGVEVECGSDAMTIRVGTRGARFDGMVYPRGLARNSSCMSVFTRTTGPIAYRLPLSACNTMSSNMDDGTIEYFNTIVVQPHKKLVTAQGKGFHVRCRYTTREKMITNDISVNGLEAVTVYGKAPMPGCTMVIYQGEQVAQSVRIGEPLRLVIAIDRQQLYSMRLTHCSVSDATNSASQPLIDEHGCAVDEEIMGEFIYNQDGTEASVEFQAHKFPYTDSVYYHCNVHLCLKDQCPQIEKCDGQNKITRKKRESDEGSPATIEVYSGLYVNDETDRATSEDLISNRALDDPNNICVSQRTFAIAIAIAGLVLMLLVIAAFIVLLARRHSRKDVSSSSIYSGPYTNTAYSHTS